MIDIIIEIHQLSRRNLWRKTTNVPLIYIHDEQRCLRLSFRLAQSTDFGHFAMKLRHSLNQNGCLLLLFLVPLLAAFYALVKDWHWLISRSNLNLHKICFVMITSRTRRRCPINIFPCCCSTKNIVNYFARGKCLLCYHSDNRIRIGACWAEKISCCRPTQGRIVVTNLKQRAI